MPNPIPVASLISRIRQDLNIEGATAFITDAEIMNRLNYSLTGFVDLLRAAGGQDYFRRSFGYTTTVGVDTYDLPGDFVSLLSVDVNLVSGQGVSCLPFQEEQRNMFRWPAIGALWTPGEPFYYRLQDRYIRLLPLAPSATSLTINYVYTPQPFVIDQATNAPRGQIDDVNGWSEWMIFDAGAGCARKMKQFDLVQMLQMERARVEERIKQMAPQRDAGMPERVHDVEAFNGWYWE